MLNSLIANAKKPDEIALGEHVNLAFRLLLTLPASDKAVRSIFNGKLNNTDLYVQLSDDLKNISIILTVMDLSNKTGLHVLSVGMNTLKAAGEELQKHGYTDSLDEATFDVEAFIPEIG